MNLHALRSACLAATCCLLAVPFAAHGQAAPAPAPAPAAAPAPVSDAVFRAVVGRPVELRTLDGQVLVGQLLALEAENAVLALPDGRVTAVARAQVLDVRLASVAPAPVPAPSAPPDAGSFKAEKKKSDPAAPEIEPLDRHFGLQFGLGPGVLVADLAFGSFYAFLSGSLALPMYSLGSNNNLGGVSLGPALSIKMASDRNWRFDLFLAGSLGYYGHSEYDWNGAQNRWTTVNGSVGLGIGFHYTAPSGFTVGFKVPVLGFAFGDDVRSLATSGEYHYLNALMSYPLATLGYRF